MGLELQTQHLTAAPAHWQWTRLSRVVQFKNGADYKTVETGEPGYPVYGSGGLFRWANSWLHNGPSVLFGRKGTIDRPLYVEGKFWTVDTMFYTVPDVSVIHPKFLYYWATRFPFAKYKSNTALPSMTQSDLGSESLALPPMSEQQKIVEFLDHETAEIDAFIDDLLSAGNLIEERWEALLVELVQQGSDNGVELIDTGLETWPVAPNTWQISRLKNSVKDAKNGAWGLYAHHDEVTVRCIRVADFDKKSARIHALNPTERSYSADTIKSQSLECGDLLIEKSGGGPTTLVGNVVIYEGAGGDMYSNFTARIQVPSGYDPLYVLYLHRSLYLLSLTSRSIKQSTGIQNLDMTRYLNEDVYFPSLREQRSIAREVDWQRLQSEEAQENIYRAIDLVRERRSALITAAVTGQIDVTQKRKPVAEVLEDEVGVRV